MESNKQWARIHLGGVLEVFHVIPVNDLKEHEEGGSCWCSPVILHKDGVPMYSHNSADGREFFEADAEGKGH